MLLLILLSACSSQDPLDSEKFISDSEYAYELLTNAYDQGRQLSLEEQDKLLRYDIYYSSDETDYDLTTNQRILSSAILIMNLDLKGLSRTTSTIGESLDHDESFNTYAEEAKAAIETLKKELEENQ
ncbi:hypothetical protein Q9251_02910 [Alkalihalobacillus macyae]|uniref:hypothetical protein n=1 Tax=Guptibacillus hwajinpoensis TaxID=208199 RepID=UPI00273B47D9|nr:hypothetical protein [Alkalihalobacillus macyae]MDP4549825.1 hypothetical protein [Alkalihalobacillus macyae]